MKMNSKKIRRKIINAGKQNVSASKSEMVSLKKNHRKPCKIDNDILLEIFHKYYNLNDLNSKNCF